LTGAAPLRLTPSWHEKIWGCYDLAPLFPRPDRRIGEVWFASQDSPILVKFLFTSDKLSVQVHPDDAYALAHENSPGKTEMWYVLGARPGSAVALGLTQRLSPDRLREASAAGDIERYLRWFPVQAGDVIFNPPGTLHSIGAGVALCEVQQNSDLTYRLYDFGRLGSDGLPRPLHIDKALAVLRQDAHPGPCRPTSDALAACEHFVVERMRRDAPGHYVPHAARPNLLIFLEGAGVLGAQPYQPGDVFQIPPALPPFEWLPASPTMALRAYAS